MTIVPVWPHCDKCGHTMFNYVLIGCLRLCDNCKPVGTEKLLELLRQSQEIERLISLTDSEFVL